MPSHRKHRARVKTGRRNHSHSTATGSTRPSPGTLPSTNPLPAMSKNCAKTPRQGPKKKKKADCRFLSPPLLAHSQLLTDHALEHPRHPLPPRRAPRSQEHFEVFLREAYHFPRLPQFRFGYTLFGHLDAQFGQPVHSTFDPNSFNSDARSPYNTPTHRYLPGNKEAYEWQKYDDLSQLDDWRITREALPPPDIKRLPEGYLFSADYLDALASLHHFFDCQRRFAGHPFSLGYRTPQTDPKPIDLEKYSPEVISLSLRRRSRGSYLQSVRAVFSSRIHFKQARTVLSSTLPHLHQRRNNKLQCFRSNRAKVNTILDPSSGTIRWARYNVVRSIVEYMLLRRNTISTLYHVSLSSLHHTSSEKPQPKPQPRIQPRPHLKTQPHTQFRAQLKTQPQTQPMPQPKTQPKTQTKTQKHTTLSRLRSEARPPTCPLETAARNHPSSFLSLDRSPWLIPPWRTDFSLHHNTSCLTQYPRRLPPDRACMSSHLSHLFLDHRPWPIPTWLAKILSTSPPWLVPPVPNVTVLLLSLAFLQQQPWMIPPWACPFLR